MESKSQQRYYEPAEVQDTRDRAASHQLPAASHQPFLGSEATGWVRPSPFLQAIPGPAPSSGRLEGDSTVSGWETSPLPGSGPPGGVLVGHSHLLLRHEPVCFLLSPQGGAGLFPAQVHVWTLWTARGPWGGGLISLASKAIGTGV